MQPFMPISISCLSCTSFRVVFTGSGQDAATSAVQLLVSWLLRSRHPSGHAGARLWPDEVPAGGSQAVNALPHIWPLLTTTTLPTLQELRAAPTRCQQMLTQQLWRPLM